MYNVPYLIISSCQTAGAERMERSCGSLGGRSRSGSSSGGRHRTAGASGGKTPATAGKPPANSSDHLMASATTALEALVASWKQQPAAAAASSAAAPAVSGAEQGVARALHFPEEPVSWWTGGSAAASESSWSNKTLENYFR
jgi:hypothetical protein